MIVGAIFGSLLALLWAFDALRLRGRASALKRLPPSEAEPSPRHVFLVRPGVVLPEATKRAASAFAEREGLSVLDLVSASLPTWRIGQLISSVDPRTYRDNRFAAAVSAGDALLVDVELLTRVRGGNEYPGDPTDIVSMAELARVLKRYASQSCDLAVTPPFPSPSVGFRDRRRLLRFQFGEPVLVVQMLIYLMLLGAWVLAPLFGLAATVILHLQFLIVTVGTPLRPNDLLVSILSRSVVDLAAALGPTPPEKPEVLAAARIAYAELLAGGTERFFEPERKDCPVCGGDRLTTALETNDRHQHKPGRFKISACRACGHRFQNPRLSIAGLEFYYRDFYDGLGKEMLETVFASDATPYLARARMVAAVSTPRKWLDVGAGHGHFCSLAREVFPDTSFDGLDMAESIEDAERRRWIDHGHRGLFPVVAPQIRASGELYDVVSMSHYLEHTIDQRSEIGAAAEVLRDGGLLFIELPDPESAFGRILGRRWMPWFQPQHLHFLSVKNLERLLGEKGFEVVATHRGEAHLPTELAFVVYIAMDNLAPATDLPWRPPGGVVATAWRRLVWLALFPVLVGAIVADRLIAPFARRPGWSNAYRVLARKQAPIGAALPPADGAAA